MFIRRRRACGDQKSVDKITAKSNDPIKQAQRNNEIKQKMDEAAEIVEEVKKAFYAETTSKNSISFETYETLNLIFQRL